MKNLKNKDINWLWFINFKTTSKMKTASNDNNLKNTENLKSEDELKIEKLDFIVIKTWKSCVLLVSGPEGTRGGQWGPERARGG